MSEYNFRHTGEVRPTMTLNDLQPALPMTVPIVGIPKGGTTMVAAVVHALGVYLGPMDELKEYNFEDQTMHQPHLERVYPEIKVRDSMYSMWGWKDPVGISSVRQVMFALRNPRLIMVFRDMLASIQGTMRFDEAHNIDPRRGFKELAEQTLSWWGGNFDYILKSSVPTLLVSYERAMSMPEQFVEEVISFLGVAPSSQQREDALARIGKGGYIVW